ncbi:MAG TPA: tetratricopeptide repeat protein [Prosthecobacter sp.]|nr:tetratricopeptide repeat protein [Prosthecobacter sp.]
MDIKGLIIRVAIIGAAVWLVRFGWNRIGDDPAMLFIYVIVLAVVAGVAMVKWVLPWIGDAASTAMLSSGEEVRPDESMKAAAKVAQGDYEGAIAEYEKSLRENPKQAFAVGEMAKICNEKLGDAQRALSVLNQHLAATQWSEDDAAFLRFRIVDIHVDTLKDFEKARELLQQVIAEFPNTRHSANAHHKMNEVEQAQFKAIQEQRLKSAGSGTA